MTPIIAALIAKGLPLIANLLLTGGSEFLKKETGIDLKLSDTTLNSADELTLKKFQLDNALELARLQSTNNQLQAEVEKAQLADAQSARLRETEMAKTLAGAGEPWWFPSITSMLAVLVVGGGGVLMTWSDSEPLRSSVIPLITLVLGYYFGNVKRVSQTSRLSDGPFGPAPSVQTPVPHGATVTTQVKDTGYGNAL